MRLITLHKAGALKISGEPTRACAVVGNVGCNDDQCRMLAKQLGWNGRTSYCGWEMIDTTNKFIRNLVANIDNESFYNMTDVEFESIRLTDSTKVQERFVLTGPGYGVTIIHGGVGLGGAYALFIPAVSRAIPQYSCSSYKSLFAEINRRMGL